MVGSWTQKVTEILEAARVPYERNVPFSRLTTIGVGGPADFLVRPTEVPALAQALGALTAEGIPLVFLGAGSNLIVSDAGYRGVVICLTDLLSGPEVEGSQVRVGAGWRLPSLVTRLTPLGLSGLEWAEGIPGSVEWWTYLRAEYGGGNWTVKRYVGGVSIDDKVDYNDIRVVWGMEFIRASGVSGLFEAGVAFDRELVYKTRDPFRPNTAFLLRAGLAY